MAAFGHFILLRPVLSGKVIRSFAHSFHPCQEARTRTCISHPYSLGESIIVPLFVLFYASFVLAIVIIALVVHDIRVGSAEVYIADILYIFGLGFLLDMVG
jgi:hypothetical protein